MVRLQFPNNWDTLYLYGQSDKFSIRQWRRQNGITFTNTQEKKILKTVLPK